MRGTPLCKGSLKLDASLTGARVSSSVKPLGNLISKENCLLLFIPLFDLCLSYQRPIFQRLEKRRIRKGQCNDCYRLTANGGSVRTVALSSPVGLTACYADASSFLFVSSAARRSDFLREGTPRSRVKAFSGRLQ